MMIQLKEKYLKAYRTPVFKNMLSLGLIQFANYLIPMLIIPFVVRALGVEGIGKVTYAQGVISYFTILVNYGFEYSATQDIAINREDKNTIRVIFWTVIRFKTILLLVSFLLLGGLYFISPKVHEDGVLYLYAGLINVGFVLFPTWFFQGVEKMAKMSIFNFLIKSIGAILTVLLIKAPSDYLSYILILSLSYVVIGIVSFIYVIRKYDLLPRIKDNILGKEVVKKGFPIFLNNFFASFYTTAGLIILGFYLSDKEIGIYSGAYKIIMAFLMISSMPINTALFPLMSRKFSESRKEGFIFFKKCLFAVGSIALLGSVMVFLAAPLIVHLFLGSQFDSAIPLLRLFSCLPFLVIVASMFTVQGMYGLQLQRYAPFIGASIGIFCVGFSFILIPKFGIYGAALGYIFSEIIEIILVASLLSYTLLKMQNK